MSNQQPISTFLGIAAAVVLVSSSYAADIFVPGGQPTIQAGINAAVNGDVVIVAQGEYFENINFNFKAITVRSTDPNDPVVVLHTIINAGGSGTVVRCNSGEGANTVLSGFVITGGSASTGGGMSNVGSSPTVINCTFIGNSGFLGGGMLNSSNSMVTNCTFIGNTATLGGGMLNIGSGPTVTNCTFTGNSATFGGGMNNTGGANPTVSNCTFSGNSANSAGGGMHNASSSPTVSNCILRGDSPDEFSGSGTPTVTYSDVQGGFLGTGNIDADPLFVDPDNGDLRLQPGSPCIDAGDNTAVPKGITTDLDGNPRFVDDPDTPDTGNGDPPIVDMGAYEFQGDCGGFPCGNNDNKVLLCHVPPGNTGNEQTLCISPNAVPAHLANHEGDHCGPCSPRLQADVGGGDALPPCPEDVNGDGEVNVLDLIDVLLCFGLPAVPVCEAEDIDGSGTVNVLDLIELLLAFGTACP